MGHIVLGKKIDFINVNHQSTKRNYLKRVLEIDKSLAAKKAKKWGFDYWDGSRKICYGGYYYDGRWKNIAKKIIKYYKLTNASKVLDIGCGKGFLVYELKKLLPDAQILGVDISKYAIKNSKKEIKKYLHHGDVRKLNFKKKYFDLVICLNTLHVLYAYDFARAISEINRVSKRNIYICVESYRNEKEKMNLLYWQVTCEMFCNVKEWLWWFRQTKYRGDYSFIFFK